MDEQKIVRSRRCGLRDVYVAKVTANNEGAYAAETPVKLARAITAKISRKYSQETIYSDDGVEDVISDLEGLEVELEVNALAPQDRALLFGNLYDSGFLVETAQDVCPEMAMGYRTRQLNGKYEFVWIYCGRFDASQDEEYETVGEKRNHKTATLKANFYPRKKLDTALGTKPDGTEKNLVRIRVDESNLAETEAQAAAAIKKWFEKVQEHPSVSVGG